MAKLVDARDLKSLGLYVCAGSTPALGTKGFLEGETLSVLNPYTPSKTHFDKPDFGSKLTQIDTKLFVCFLG